MTDAPALPPVVLTLAPSGCWHITFRYKNYRGDVSERHVIAQSVQFAATEWHPEPQWLLEGFDVEKRAVRKFAMRDMENVTHGAF